MQKLLFMASININSIKDGMSGITPAIGNYLFENCLVCLNNAGHSNGVALDINGLRKDSFSLEWDGDVTDQMLRSYKDELETTEQGAVCISVLMAKQLTDYTVIERSWRGTGIDYWLGYEDDPLLQRAARLEISGIKAESATNTVTTRYEQKKKQASQSANTLLPAYISIVEFSNPKILFNTK